MGLLCLWFYINK